MQQLSIFATPQPTPAPAKVLQFRQPVVPPKPQEELTEAIYPEYKYGACVPCGRSILIPGLDSAKCERCGWTEQRRKRGTVPAFNSAKKPDSVTATVLSSPISNREILATCEPLPQPSVEPVLPSFCQPEPASRKIVTSSNVGRDANTAIISEKNVTNSTDEKPTAKGKVLSFFTTRTRAEKMGRPDPFLAGIKVCTRRIMAESTAEWYQRAFVSGQTIQVYSAGQYAGGIKWADIRLTRAPYQQVLKDIQPEDLVAEGDLWDTKEEFIADLCLGRPDPELSPWVLWFEVVNKCVEFLY